MHHLFVMTGAGISADSGVRTFRDAGGLWEGHRPEDVATPAAWARDPQLVWRFYQQRRAQLATVQPNDAHRALAAAATRLAAAGHRLSLITQNVDDLHERAGSGNVQHLHGSLFEFRCDRCDSRYDGDIPDMPEPELEAAPPACGCGGLIRPDIVWFGENLPEGPWDASVQAVQDADVMIVVGTSGIVYPAAGLPELALRRGIPVIEVNPEDTPLSGQVTAVVRESAGDALPTLLPRLIGMLG